MKAITIHQPWASLIAFGHKRFETRSWQTPFRGRIAIHAGRSLEAFEGCANGQPNEPWFDEAIRLLSLQYQSIYDFPFGRVIAVGNLIACHPASAVRYRLSDADRLFGDFSYGRFAWEIDNVKLLQDPYEVRGKQRLWNWDVTGILLP